VKADVGGVGGNDRDKINGLKQKEP
jgi:hypothetical protein